MDIEFLVQMVFVLILTLMIGGMVLLFPLARRLGTVTEEWLRIRRMEAEEGSGHQLAGSFKALNSAVASLEEKLDAVVERQEFVESLIESSDQPSLTGQ